MFERRIYGPPGCGKTTELMQKVVPAAVEKYGEDGVLVTSFSKAAARELLGAALMVNPASVGTLHSLCYRAMGSPPIAEVHAKLWNEQYPHLAISGQTAAGLENGMDEFDSDGMDGDELLNQVNIYRAKLTPQNLWMMEALRFYDKWTAFKKRNGFIDFTDMIDHAVGRILYAPAHGDVSIGAIIVDEAQDLTPLQLKLIRSWGAQANWYILVGDDDQAIYGFIGADPREFLAKNPNEKRTLTQSYRVPARVLDYSMKIIRNVSVREEKEYHPRIEDGRPAEGSVLSSHLNYKNDGDIVDMIAERIDQNRTVMFLTTCSYMLQPVKQCLMNRGIPFHNPYRKRRADWNPLARGGHGRTTARDLLVNFLTLGKDNGYWTVEQFIKWAKFLMVGDNGLVRKQGKSGIKALEQEIADNPGNPGLGSCREVIGQIMSPPAVEAALRRDMKWLAESLQTRKKDTLEYPIRVINKYGIDALSKNPKVIIGTVHSVKGGESQCVIIAPDLSYKAQCSFNSSVEGEDDIWRVFYVGATRAREELVVLNKTGRKKTKFKLI